MQADIARWMQEIEKRILEQRGGKKLQEALDGHGEFLSVQGHDGSILEYKLGENATYTRVVWSEHNPKDKPFAFSSYVSREYPDSPKTDFYTEPYVPQYLSAAEVEKHLFGA